MKLKLLVITLSLFVCTSLAFADTNGVAVRQISYDLEIFELTQSDARILGLEFPEPIDLVELGATSVTRLVHSPGLIQILRAGASLFQLTASQERSENARLAQPQITVALGETGKFSLATEEWIGDRKDGTFESHYYGLQMLLTPAKVDHGGEQVLTTVELSTVTPQQTSQQLLTTVWTENGAMEPLGILTYQEAFQRKGLLRNQQHFETRYFAVFMRAEAITHLNQDRQVQVGTLGGLSSLLWPKEVEPQPSSISIGLPVIPLELPELAVKWWLTSAIRLELDNTNIPKRLRAALGVSLVQQELVLQGQLTVSDSETFLALGLADQVRIHPSVVLRAGIFPLVIDLSDFKLEKSLPWWAEIEFSQGRIYASAKYALEHQASVWEGTLGYNWTDCDLVYLRYRTNAKEDQLSLGYRREF